MVAHVNQERRRGRWLYKEMKWIPCLVYSNKACNHGPVLLGLLPRIPSTLLPSSKPLVFCITSLLFHHKILLNWFCYGTIYKDAKGNQCSVWTTFLTINCINYRNQAWGHYMCGCQYSTGAFCLLWSQTPRPRNLNEKIGVVHCTVNSMMR
jgi:hypothetical protein